VCFSIRGIGHNFEIPHDLAHLAIEGALGLKTGFWGSAADGGVFPSMTHESGRRKPKAAERSKFILKANARALVEAEVLVSLFDKAITEAGADHKVTLAVRPEGISLGEGELGENRLRGAVEDINFLGSIVRIRLHLGDATDGKEPTVIALDTFNEPHLRVPAVGESITVAFPPEACFVLGAARDGAAAQAEAGSQV